MNLRQLAYFVAVVEEGSFTKAAQKMHVAQPSLSQQIRALEEEIGGELFKRLPRAVKLTQAGTAFLPDARAAVSASERAANAARAALKLEVGELEVATVRSIAVGILPSAIRIWRDRYPMVSLRLHEFIHRELLEQSIQSGFGDIAIGPRPTDWPGPLSSLGWEEFVVVLPPNDPLAFGPDVRLEQLSDRDWVAFPRHHGLSELVSSVCGSVGFQPSESIRTEQVEAAARLAAAGLGPALVPLNIIPQGLDAAVLSVDPPIMRELVAYARTEWSPAAREYLSIVREQPWRTLPEEAIVVP